MSDLRVLHKGAHSVLTEELQRATKRRLDARDLHDLAKRVKVDGVAGPATFAAVRKAAWALGALPSTYEALARTGEIPIGVQRMIRNPGKRTDSQKAKGKARISQMRADRKARAKAEASVGGKRMDVVKLCLEAAQNYRANPGAYHYLAGGKANLVFLKPTPRDWRSDCSQFASSVQNAAGGPDLGPNGPLWVNTVIMAQHLKQTTSPQPGDFGMYGSRSQPHHVEVYLGSKGGPGHEFVGHGSQPIDSLTPGRPSFYLHNPIG